MRIVLKKQNIFNWLLLITTLLHLSLLGLRLGTGENKALVLRGKSVPIKVRLVPFRPIPPNLQIVQSENGKSVSDRKLDDAYLSDRNRFFNRETQAKVVAPFNKGGKGKQFKKSGVSLSDLGAYKKGHDPIKVAAKEFTERLNRNQNEAGNRHYDGRGVSSSSDYLLNVPVGDVTYLNTVEYKYYGFFFRIRQKLEQFWGRNIEEKAKLLMNMGRRIASDEHITSLEIILTEKGEITEIIIKGTSGVKELDDAAIESLNQAGPFPNPPKGLVVNGRVKIEWGFIVKS